MTDRTAQILEAAIQGFITTGEPISSGWLFDNFDFGIKPAMIRLELDALEDADYLMQPHHSAGRIPTDAGYEFLADRLMQTALAHENARPAPRESTLRELLEEHAWAELSARISRELGLLGVAADLTQETVYKAGLEALVERLEWQNRDELQSVIRDFEDMDERIPRVAGKVGEGLKVFIGRKSPVTRSEHLAVVGGNFDFGDGTISIFAIGPKRMDYKKVIRIFRNF